MKRGSFAGLSKATKRKARGHEITARGGGVARAPIGGLCSLPRATMDVDAKPLLEELEKFTSVLAGDYVQAEAIGCEALEACHTNGEKSDMPGQGSP